MRHSAISRGVYSQEFVANEVKKSRNRMSVAFWLEADGVRGRWGKGHMGSLSNIDTTTILHKNTR